MAGESPDRSKQHEASADDSAGSAGVTSAADSTGPVEDEELREAVSAWVRSAGKPSASDEGAKAGEPSGGSAAEEGSGSSEEAAAEVPDDTFKDSGKDDATDATDGLSEGSDGDTPDEDPEDAPEGASASAEGSAEDAEEGDAEDASADDAEDRDAPAAKDGDESADDAPEGATGSAEGSTAPEGDAKLTADGGPKGSGKGTSPTAESDAKDASGSADGSGTGTGTPAAEGGDAAPEASKADAPAPAAEDDAESAPKGAGKATAIAGVTDTPGPTGDAEDDVKAAPKGAGKATAEGAAGAAAKDTPRSTKDTPAAKADPDADGIAKDTAKGTPLPAPRGDAEGASKKAGGKPVDTPTTALKSPAAKKPQVDQPTTMLKVGGKAKPAPAQQEAERTSKFVALKPDLKGPSARVEETRAVPQVGPERTTQQPLPPKPPLDLLAELTNTPPPPETPVRTLVRRVKIWTPLVILLVVILGVVQAMRPLPQPTLALTAKDSFTFEGGKPDIPWPADGQAALDVQGIGSFGSSGSGKPVPIASVAKVMTAYLILRDHPLKSGAEGPKIAIDKAAQDQSKAGQESTVDVTQGDKITQREALEGVLIASANNVARLLARWDAGSEKAFVAKMNAAAKGLGMSGTTYTDPSGLTNSTVSTAADQVKLAKAAMRQPAFREVAAMMSYTDYKGTYHSNWNQLVGHNNVVGIKTGTTTSALGNLVFAAKQDVGGETRMVIGAVLRQPPGGRENTILSAALDHSDALIRAAQGALKSETVLKKGTVVGYVDDGLGGETPVEVTEDVKAAGWAGLKVRLSFTSGTIPHTAKAGTEVGSLTVGDGSSAGAVKVPVALRADLAEPGLGSKLTRIG
ncbi:D-alanyl-D-alanine carboxypeptidase [Streptomyces sp. NBC_01171]|uniref:D-alanyl-D-alanine carboxypeptidase n=1 Tax=Streptomyces sp. NBC_01171 TaxID=2903757 RepID=UPI00386D4A12|nr:D-alanyl-D-alanine carboxypeptidase [Streptomyces sp. NBC_01171]